METKRDMWPQGLKKTRPRELVFSVLEQAGTPLTAADILKRIEAAGATVWLSTVYRVLDTFVEKAMVLRTAGLENDMAAYEINRHLHRHYAVCIGCHKMVAVENCPIDTLSSQLAESDFQVLGHEVKMFGYCKDCKKAE